MKKLLIMTLMLIGTYTMASAQKQAEIKFDALVQDVGN